jgi:hypothetical protein
MKKQILVALVMVFSFTGFAINSENQNNFKTNTVNEFKLDYGYFTVCEATIQNRETGETRTVQSFGYGSTRSSSMQNCSSNVRRLAQAVADELNKQ